MRIDEYMSLMCNLWELPHIYRSSWRFRLLRKCFEWIINIVYNILWSYLYDLIITLNKGLLTWTYLDVNHG